MHRLYERVAKIGTISHRRKASSCMSASPGRAERFLRSHRTASPTSFHTQRNMHLHFGLCVLIVQSYASSSVGRQEDDRHVRSSLIIIVKYTVAEQPNTRWRENDKQNLLQLSKKLSMKRKILESIPLTEYFIFPKLLDKETSS